MLVTLSGITVVMQPAINLFEAVSIMALQLLRLSYFLLPFDTMIEVKLLQYAKAPLSPKKSSSMLVTLLGIVIEVRPLQPSKAQDPMLVTLSGIVIEVRPMQSSNALFPMLVRLLEIVIEVRPRQPQKASSPMLVTLLGIVIEVRPLQS